jgi:phosphodiesterase/alkaline phosphatase D-like protein
MKMRKTAVLFVLIPFLVALLTVDIEVRSASEPVYAATELLCRPTDTSITVNALADRDLYIYLKYGTASGALSRQTVPEYYPGNSPINIQLTDLQPDTRYYYRMVHSESNSGPWTEREEHAFQTQRSVGSSFSFTISSDSHLTNLGTSALFQQTVNNILADNPDFHIDLGDTFGMDSVTTDAQARQLYLSMRSYFGTFGHSTPLFLALGNHENEEGWNLDDNPSSPLLSVNARKLYYPNPIPNGFYSGNTDPLAAINGDHLREDYYAWQWGNALFIVIDPYWYTMKKPYSGSTGGEKNDETDIGNRWDWTLGYQQYQWFKQTLENSTATYKFVFAHHLTGGTQDYVRGGAEAAPYFEWGGRNADGSWAFDTKRPGWTLPIHDLMVANGVKAFFHGHDHEYAKEQRDGIVYQLVPMAADSGYGYGFNLYKESDPYTEVVLPNSGHLRVTVSPSQATVDYVRSYTSGGNNRQVAYSYNIAGNSSSQPPAAPSNLSASAASSTQINLNWQDNSSNESGFRIERKEGSGGNYSQIATTAANAAAYGDSGLSSGKTYFYRIRAYNANGDSAYSGEASATTSSSASLPAAPSDPAATAASSTQINVTWKDNSDNESGFLVESITAADTDYRSVVVAAGTTSCSFNSLTPATNYLFRVSAYNAIGSSNYSDIAYATTLSSPPTAPSNLTASAASSTQINISWRDNSSNESGFKIERKTGAGGAYSKIASAAANATAYSDAGLSSGVTYYYRILAYNASGDSNYSGEASATTLTQSLDAPSNLTAAAVSSNQINLSWQDNSGNESGFRIERKTGAGGTYSQIAAAAANAVSYSDASGLSPNSTYYYRIAAYNADGNSAYTNEAQATTPSSSSPNLALNKTATADSQQTANPASKGNDGSASTRWSANNYRTNHWWKVDLGAVYALTGTKVQFQFARNYKYKIEVSADGVNWTVAVNQTTTTSTAQTREDSFSATGRFVRITYTGLPAYPMTMASHFEFQVLGGN